MIAFDAAERNNCTIKRQNTSTPLQPLILLNDPQFVEAARKLGERAMHEGGSTIEDRAVFICRSVWSRHPAERELTVLKKLFEEQLHDFASDAKGADEFLAVGQTRLCDGAAHAELAAMASIALAVLNHDEAVSKR
jgi:hypothetical protein